MDNPNNPWNGSDYAEPSLDQPHNSSPWESSGSSYPPPPANPFNVSRSSAARVMTSNNSPQGGSTNGSQSLSDSYVGATGRASPSKSATSSQINRPPPPPCNKMVLGVAVVDFNHLVGPTVEWSYPSSLTRALEKDEALTRLLPFLALPDGAHLSEEDYAYFHCMYNPSIPPNHLDSSNQSIPEPSSNNEDGEEEDTFPALQTIFGISCNRQIQAADLLVKADDVTRSTVQKAVVVLASRPVFGPLRDKLGLVTRALFAQRDFSNTDLLPQFYDSLEAGLRDKENESNMYIGTSLRELLHKFRHRTLTIVKLLMLQKRIMLYGYPVERLCTFQYSLVSLMPGLLLNLTDAGDPALDFRSARPSRPTSLRTSDRNSLLRYMGLPLHTFGADAFFQPYLPLQQIDQLTAKSWLVGTTNSIVTQQRDCEWDLLINIDQNSFEFRDKELERLVSLTASDRAWMDQVVKSVEDTWNPSDPTRPIGVSFRGSDDDLRSKFEEYICSALATLKYVDFRARDPSSLPIPGELPGNAATPFSERWLDAVRKTRACKTWYESTDELLFDICEPRHPFEGKANAISDIGIRLTEGLHDLQLGTQLGPTRDAIGSAFAAGSSSFFKAFDGVRSEVSSRLAASPTASNTSATTSTTTTTTNAGMPTTPNGPGISGSGGGLRKLQTATAVDLTTSPHHHQQAAAAPSTPNSAFSDVRSTVGGIGSFFGSRLASWQGTGGQAATTASASPTIVGTVPSSSSSGGGIDSAAAAAPRKGLRPLSLAASATKGPTSSGKD